jgi:predicted nucleic acid-binding protein
MGLVVDTSAIIAWERRMGAGGKPELRQDEILVMPAIVWAEALIGVRMAHTAKQAAQRLSRLEAMRRILGVEPFSAKIAEHYADIFAELSAKGVMIPMNDISVAATARFLGFGVLIGEQDERHFRQVDGLLVEVMVADVSKD